MHNIKSTRKFDKAIATLPVKVRIAFYGKLDKLRMNITHPSLRAKKILGTYNPELWEGSINMNYRFVFHFDADETIVLDNIGTHDLLNKGKY